MNFWALYWLHRRVPAQLKVRLPLYCLQFDSCGLIFRHSGWQARKLYTNGLIVRLFAHVCQYQERFIRVKNGSF